MSEPTLNILGVYKPQISAETWQEQWDVTGDDEATRQHFDQLVVLEAIADNSLVKPFDMAKFGQMQLQFPNDPSRMMVG